MKTEGLTAAVAPFGLLSFLGRSNVKCLEHINTHRPPSCTVHTQTLQVFSDTRVWRRRVTHFVSLHIQKSQWQTEKQHGVKSKRKYLLPEREKARGKQYGNEHVGLNTSYFCARCLKQHRHWTSDFKKAVDCKDWSPTLPQTTHWFFNVVK